MFFDFGLKSSYSIGYKTPELVSLDLRDSEVGAIAFSDLFCVEQNDTALNISSLQVYSGSEWFCRNAKGERIDLIFVGFEITDELKSWVMREARCFYHKSSDVDMTSKKFVKVLPDVNEVIDVFSSLGASWFLSASYFCSTSRRSLTLIRELKEQGMSGIVSFSRFGGAFHDITGNELEVCLAADLLPVTASTFSNMLSQEDYSVNRPLVEREAPRSMSLLTDLVMEEIDANANRISR